MKRRVRGNVADIDSIIFLVLRRMRFPLLVVMLAYAISVGGLVLVPGQDSDGNPWKFDFFHAFYFISFTGPTIGFGEIPYEFTGAQRMWVTFCIYMTVISWLFAIGKILQLSQDKAFTAAVARQRIAHKVRRIKRPFWIVCGYGDTGHLIVQSLARRNIRCTVIEKNQKRLNDLSLTDLHLDIPALQGDAGKLKHLRRAGLESPSCVGVMAMTDNEACNVKISVAVKLIRPDVQVIGRAEEAAACNNMRSFNTEVVINAYDLFAERMLLAIQAPKINLLHAWLGSLPGHDLQQPILPPKGQWIVCGCGDFGNAVIRDLKDANIPVTVIESDPQHAPSGAVVGTGVEANTLYEAGIMEASGLIAGTPNDANNLSIVLTARELNPKLYCASRQNERDNSMLFAAAKLDFSIEISRIITWRVLALVTVRDLDAFLDIARHESDEWSAEAMDRIEQMTYGKTPETFSIEVSETETPTVYTALTNGQRVEIGHLLTQPGNNDKPLPALPLMLTRENGEQFPLPTMNASMEIGDRLLLCARLGCRTRIRWVLNNPHILEHALSGTDGSLKPDGYLWRGLAKIRGRHTTA